MLQRQLSSFDIKIIVDELQEIKDYIVEKSYQISQNEIIIKIKNIKTKKKLTIFIQNGKFLSLTNKQFISPKKPSNFIMAIRKYIQNGRILNIYQHEFDRIIKIKIGKKTGIFTLVIEFFSEGNIILVNPNSEIIIPFIHQTWSHRKVKGRQEYLPPPSQINPFILKYSDFHDIIKVSDADIVRTIAVKLNLSGPIAEEICLNAKIDKNLEITNISKKDLEKIFNSIQQFLTRFSTHDYHPVLIKHDDNVIDILPFLFESYKEKETIPIDKFTEGLSTFITIKENNQENERIEKITDETIGKISRILKQQQEKISLLNEKIKEKKQEGDLIYLHYNTIDQLLQTIQKSMNEKEKNKIIDFISQLEFVKTFNPIKNKLIVSLLDTNNEKVDIPLQFRKTVSENAECAYDESKKAQKKKQGAEKSIRKTQETLKQILTRQAVQQKNLREDRFHHEKMKRKHHWFDQYRWTISTQGNLIVGGKDAKTNERLIKKYMEKQDRYVHADIQGAPSCIVKQKTIDDKPLDISDETMVEACIFAACYSKAWKQFSDVQSYWVLPHQVSKTPQSGEFVPKGAFIIRGKRNYCKCPLEMGIGELIINDETRWIGGPIASIKKWCEKYIIIKPGGMSRKNFSNMIAQKTDANSNEIDQILPSGGISVSSYHGITIDSDGGIQA